MTAEVIFLCTEAPDKDLKAEERFLGLSVALWSFIFSDITVSQSLYRLKSKYCVVYKV